MKRIFSTLSPKYVLVSFSKDGKRKRIILKEFGVCSIGTYENIKAIESALTDSGVYLTDLVKKTISSTAFKFTRQKKVQLFIQISASDLGFKNGGRYKDIINSILGAVVILRGRKYIVEFCLPEVALYLRLQYKNQPVEPIEVEERVDVVMEPIKGERNDYVLRLVHDTEGIALAGHPAHENCPRYSGDKFIFSLRAK
ncbi:MAG TPA: hypothetical protein PKZ36_01790 [Candidatus Paceibacterota bacterium]|nr:hypothetical protein [Candidatus Paceibacterota bacterium]HPT18119.1 hypothetical protein [Candidatus Paceibacterota bacterium]